MHAILREATYATDTPVHESREFKEYQALHARQPGYVGSYVIDAGDGRLFTVTLWESPTHAAAARAVLEPVVRRVLHPLMNAPSRLLATGPVVRHDAADATAAPS